MNDVYPMLKPSDWKYRSLAVHKVLHPDERVPVIALGYDDGEIYRFVLEQECDDPDGTFAQAMRNVDALDYPWEPTDAKGLTIATSSGNEFSAERVLSQRAMNECHELLDAKRLIVATPRRTVLYAVNEDMSDEHRGLFLNLVQMTYEDDSYGHAPIGPMLFIVEDGRLDGVAFTE